jgi:broad specificity phosphatase PhoE
VGEWQGLTHEEIEEGWPGYLASQRRPPGFEDEAAIIARVSDAFGDLARRYPAGEVLVVSHAGVLRVMRRSLRATDRRIANLGGARFDVWTGPDGGVPRIVAGELVDLIEHGEVGEEL